LTDAALKTAPERNEQGRSMRLTLVLLLALSSADIAAAQTADCSKPNAPGVACPPASKDKPAQAKAPQAEKKSFDDPTLIDETALKTKIKSICRGC
jgi:hypothetical protein